jgi:SAM-dependent methyltransferase
MIGKALRRWLRHALLRMPPALRRRIEIRLLRGYEAYLRIRARGGEEPLEADGYPVPSAKLRILVSGTADAGFFLDTGRRQAELFRSLYERHAGPIADASAVLDFGCGCGRLTRHWADVGGPTICACDPNPALLRWTASNLPFVSATLSGDRPPLPYGDSTFDFVYALSVFTHLPELQALPWVSELRRVTKPGGLLLFTTAGEAYSDRLTKPDAARYASGEAVVQFDSASGTNLCIVYHPPAYVRSRMLDGFELVEQLLAPEHPEQTRELQFAQDCYLVRAVGAPLAAAAAAVT